MLSSVFPPHKTPHTPNHTLLLQVGDILDRGPNELKLLYWLERLQQEAQRAGGRLYVLNGNHETMNIHGNYRWVLPAAMPNGQCCIRSQTTLGHPLLGPRAAGGPQLGATERRTDEGLPLPPAAMERPPSLPLLGCMHAFTAACRTLPSPLIPAVAAHHALSTDAANLGCSALPSLPPPAPHRYATAGADVEMFTWLRWQRLGDKLREQCGCSRLAGDIPSEVRGVTPEGVYGGRQFNPMRHGALKPGGPWGLMIPFYTGKCCSS
jgi:hypothetical protein